MRVRKITSTIFIIFVCIFASGAFLTPLESANADQNQSSLIITILDAYYANLDNGGEENDIFVEFTTNITVSEENSFFILHFTLILPSGTHYHYYTSLWVPYTTDYSGRLYFYNYATEAGWYEVKSLGILFQEDSIDWYTTSYTFDPPGGTGGDDPQSIELLLSKIDPSDTS